MKLYPSIKRLFRSLSLVAALMFVACSDDDYVYPNVVTEFVDAYVNASNRVEFIITDQGETLTLTNKVSAADLEPDRYYRALCRFETSDSESGTPEALAYSVRLIYAAAPQTQEAFEEGVKTDPIEMQSLWRGGAYLNLIALPKAQNIDHEYGFVEDSVRVDAQGVTRLYLKLHHDRNEDLEAYEQKVYLSVPLQGYTLQPGDSIYFRVNTYEEGLKTWKFAY